MICKIIVIIGEKEGRRKEGIVGMDGRKEGIGSGKEGRKEGRMFIIIIIIAIVVIIIIGQKEGMMDH